MISCNTLIPTWWICLKKIRKDCYSCVRYCDDEIQLVWFLSFFGFCFCCVFFFFILVRNSCLPELALLLSYRVFGGGGGFFPFPFKNAVRTLRTWCSKIHKLSRSGFSGATKDNNYNLFGITHFYPKFSFWWVFFY